MSGIVLHSEYERIMSEVKELRTVLSELIYERDELLLHQCRNILTDYMLKIGVSEHKAYELEVKILMIKREIELMQAKINRQEAFILSDIKLELEREFETYRKKLDEQAKKINEAVLYHGCEKLSKTDKVELKRLYKFIVKKLHPDLNPGVTQEQTDMFLSAIGAYKNGDLDCLKAIFALIDDGNDDGQPEGFEQLRKMREALKNQIDKVKSDCGAIKNSFPYNQRDFLSDKQAVEAKRQALTERIKQYHVLYEQYEQKLKTMTPRQL